MKKTLFLLVALVASMSMNAQVMKGNVVVATYTANQADNVVFEEAQGSTTTGTAKRTGDIDVKWIQLWANGPKFAEYNVGAENNKAEDYGGYYWWGGSVNKSATDYNRGNSVLTGDNDTATKLWGDNWRMPTDRELTWMISKCTWKWKDEYKKDGTNIKGFILTGKEEGYTENSIFLPAAGYFYYGVVDRRGDDGGYWSSTPNGSNYAFFLYVESGRRDLKLLYRDFGFSVRAVLKE